MNNNRRNNNCNDRNNINKYAFRFSLPLSLALLFAASLAVTGLMFFLQPDTGFSVKALVRTSYGLTFFLNWLPVICVMLALFFLCGNLVTSCALPGLVFVLLSVVNRYMIAMRWAPLRPFDLLLGMEFFGIAKSIKPVVFITLGLGLVLFAALFVLCLLFFKNNKPRPLFRLIGFAAVTLLALLLNANLYANASVNARLPYAGSPYNETDMYQSKGFTYSFLYALNTSRVAKPAYYEQYRKVIEEAEVKTEAGRKAEAEVKTEAGRKAEAETKTDFTAASSSPLDALETANQLNVVMILSEAFSEMPLSPYINFDGYIDPMAFYKTLKAESVSGYIVVPHVGGGTSDTEFDILTGLNTRDFRGVPYSFSMVTRPFPGFTAVLKSAGYAALGLHPGAGWFYNRQNVYPLLGFDAFLDDTTYDRNDTKGMYITESQAIARIIDEYQRHLDTAPTVPLFLDCITIQNHGPYNGKYNAALNFNTDLPLSVEEKDALANYFEGIADCDRELRNLTTYLNSVAVPTILVYYGDHLPSFSPSIYQALIPEPESSMNPSVNAPTNASVNPSVNASVNPSVNAANAPGSSGGTSLIRYNRPPFLIWTNDAAKGMLNTASFEQSLPADHTISAYYLGAALLEMMGLDSLDPFMAYVNTMRADYPVVLEQTWQDSNGINHVFDPAETPTLALYRSWAYYRIVTAGH